METNDKEKLIDTMAENQKFFEENGYWPTIQAPPRPAGKPKQEACEDPECYHRFPESIILRDIQGGTVPEEALRKSCCWSKISEVRGKHRRKIGIRSATWWTFAVLWGLSATVRGEFRPL